MEVKTALVKYVFLDIVNYSFQRTVEAQVKIIEVLNTMVLQAVNKYKINPKHIIYLPTGDGICICLINTIDPYDLHMRIALDILTLLNEHNLNEIDAKRKFNIRIGINENHDSLVVDINDRNNVAGAGINIAQRIMNLAEDNQILVGQSVYEKLGQREMYYGKFKTLTSEIKHGIILKCYQYLDYGMAKKPPLGERLRRALLKQLGRFRRLRKRDKRGA